MVGGGGGGGGGYVLLSIVCTSQEISNGVQEVVEEFVSILLLHVVENNCRKKPQYASYIHALLDTLDNIHGPNLKGFTDPNGRWGLLYKIHDTVHAGFVQQFDPKEMH